MAAKLLAAFQHSAGGATSARDAGATDDSVQTVARHTGGGRLARVSVPAGETLTERERQVLQLVSEGASNLQIARRLHLAEGTVKNHISFIMDKLGASNRTQAVTIARQRGLIG